MGLRPVLNSSQDNPDFRSLEDLGSLCSSPTRRKFLSCAGRVGDPSYGRRFSDIALARRGPRNTKSRRAGLSKTRSAERAEPPRNRHCCTLDSTAGVASFLGTRFTTHRTTGYDRRGKRPSPRRTDCATGSSACLPKRGLAIGGGSHTPRFPHVSATTSLPTRMAQ
jgi:hypothetical protein